MMKWKGEKQNEKGCLRLVQQRMRIKNQNMIIWKANPFSKKSREC